MVSRFIQFGETKSKELRVKSLPFFMIFLS